MFKFKKKPVLTDDYCNKINKIIAVIENHTKRRIRLKRFDFNSGKGQVYLEGKSQVVRDIEIIFEREDLVTFSIGVAGKKGEWSIAYFYDSEEASRFSEHEEDPRWLIAPFK